MTRLKALAVTALIACTMLLAPSAQASVLADLAAGCRKMQPAFRPSGLTCISRLTLHSDPTGEP